MAPQEGYHVRRLDDKLGYGQEDYSTIIAFFVGVILFALVFSEITFGHGDVLGLLSSFIVALMGGAGLLGAIRGIRVDSQDFVEAFREDNPEETEIEILYAGYSKARTRIKDALSVAVMAWLVFGGYAGAIEIAVFEGIITIKDWTMLGVLHFLSFVSFILAIVLYLRKRSIEKALFAIQLKKSDKAEISIKI